jgi:hypothetical protein
VWKRQIDGRVLTFRLAGINNQNFLMRDEETGSFWQQISGQAISGPLRGKQLELVHSDELSFGLWRQENPGGTMLQAVAEFESQYAQKDWESKMQKTRTVVDTSQTGIAPRELMLGLVVEGQARAYPVKRLEEAKLIEDRLGQVAVLLVLGPDGKSVRAFARGAGEFYRDAAGEMMDAETGSRWDFRGCAVSGSAVGKCLRPLTVLKDYWFDWQQYHPETTVFRR